jgi:hypothetical protein
MARCLKLPQNVPLNPILKSVNRTCMKSSYHILLAFIPLLMLTIWSYTTAETSGVRGMISPAEAVQSVLLVSARDTIRYIPVNGFFEVVSRPGIYQLIVDAIPGYKDMMLERLVVEETRMTNIGELVLQKVIP